ncbi:MAG: protein translocase subunit SecD [Actinobacteria bacterium]|nr:protein translocase subunit SecD [Actinomycetota bacterium]
MAPPAGTLRVGRYFLALLAILAILYGLVFLPGHKKTPKLGLDLEGGTQVTFKARTPDGKAPSKSSMSEARDIMEQRVNGYGVSNAEVVVQGSDEIVISIPGKSASDIANIGAAAVLNFRPLITSPVGTAAARAAQAAAQASTSPSPTASGSASSTPSATASTQPTSSPVASPSSSVSGKAQAERPLAAGQAAAAATTPASSPAATSPAASAPAASSPAASATPSVSATAATPQTNYCADPPTQVTGTLPTCADPLSSLAKAQKLAIPTTDTAFNALTSTQQSALQSAMSQFKCSSKPADNAAAKTLLACDSANDNTASVIYLLGAIIVPGTEISNASAVAPGSQVGQVDWQVTLHLKSTGQANWAKWTAAHNIGSTNASTADISTCGASGTACADFVAFTLDAAVLEAPVTEGTINGDTTISGGFNQKSAQQLAQQLNYGALPLSFDTLNTSTVSATLGSGQLKAGLLAGGIGLILVILYSLIYYRALGLVTITSLIVSGVLTYACLVILGREIGFTLTLAGIAGFIVAVGITADSFVVFFERIKDEVHEGRTMRVAVPRAWVRARRTILSADTVSFLAAATLYYFAAGDVQGFAFTLGLSTILDLVVVFLFTHPLISLLSRSRTFGSARFTGLNSAREGGVAVLADSPRRAPTPRRARPSTGAAGESR